MVSSHNDIVAAPPKRIAMLDGWRALSILLVLAGHLFPIGPKAWLLNGAVASAGMAIFFTLSGFLITSFLLGRPDVPDFLRRRLFRIVPLAWTAMLILVLVDKPDQATTLSNLLFVANLPPQHLLFGGGHLWSLCVEMQFYIAVALLVALAGRRSLYVLPIICLLVTGLRVGSGAYIDIVTWRRLDEILAGATLALVYAHTQQRSLEFLRPFSPVLLVLVIVAAHPASGPLNYLRPYLAASAVGCSLFAAPEVMRRVFTSKSAAYIANVSYALYVWHGMFSSSWLGSGTTLIKYLKRPFLLLVTFGAAHLSTFYFEQHMIELGKRLGSGRRLKPGAST